ncbi:MAG: sulfite reductase subunit alpha [Lentisphaeria bacterium]|nr:sulfite reductase subunit alpha [Lentisphaeria bacterium]
MEVPYIPPNAPFNPDQRQWLAGFFAGLHSRMLVQSENVAAAQSNAVQKPIAILYGTQTGNSEELANEAAQEAKENGLVPSLIDMGDCTAVSFTGFARVVMVCSTYGEGEMPDNAQELWEAFEADDAPRIDGVPFGILALGDTNYDLYCEAGRLWDERLAALGGERIIDRVDCDVDYEEAARAWIKEIMPRMAAHGGNETAGAEGAVKAEAKTGGARWTRTNPYDATLLKRVLLSAKGSGKEIVHYEISLGDSEIEYRAGDIVNIFSTNEIAYVDKMIEILQCSGDEMIPTKGEDKESLRHLLTEVLDIRRPSRDLIQLLADRSGDRELGKILESKDSKALDDYLYGKDTLDLMNKFGSIPLSGAEFCRLAKPLAARAYSISSCPLKHENEVHVTVASVRWDYEGREHKGICSTYLADILAEEKKLKVYFTRNKHFRIPEDESKNIIMVGPGTGIAPFRAFLEEREMTCASGKNWLFFGDRNEATDFIYKDELLAMKDSGILNRLDLAWSRDQKEKIYVQNRMLENAEEIFKWLEAGAYFYVCGDAYYMAKDVDKALHDIIAEQGMLSAEEADSYVSRLKKDKRYVRDVY